MNTVGFQICYGNDCGDTHLHCFDCYTMVPLDDLKRCAYGCSQSYARCQDCALDHYDTNHRREVENRPQWEQVP